MMAIMLAGGPHIVQWGMLQLLFCGLLAFPAPAAAAPLCPDCSVVLVSLDAVQAAHVGALGGRKGVTPRFDRLAARGVLFTQAVSPAPWTVPASMSWFTGAEPSTHKVTNKFADYAGKIELANLARLSGLRTLADALKAAGYATGGFTADAGVNGAFGFKQGFDVYVDSVPPFHGYERSIPEAMAWLSREKPAKYFLFLHGYDAHGQHAPIDGLDRRYAAGYKGRFDGSPRQQRDLRELGLEGKPLDLGPADVAFWRAVYDEKINRADALLGVFFDYLEHTKRLDKTVVVLVADHGTEFYEHRRFDHGATLYDELVHVPLAVIVPGGPSGERVTHQVGTLSLMPTILDLLGVAPDEGLRRQMRGRSLVPDMLGRTREGQDVFLETDYRLFTRKRGLRTKEGLKYVLTVEDGKQELYDLRSDPGELKDLAASRPETAGALRLRVMGHYRELDAPLEGGLPLGCLAVYGDQCR